MVREELLLRFLVSFSVVIETCCHCDEKVINRDHENVACIHFTFKHEYIMEGSDLDIRY